MIFTPEERRAILAVSALLILGQILILWREKREEKPNRELSRWLERLAEARAEGADSSDSPDLGPGSVSRRLLSSAKDTLSSPVAFGTSGGPDSAAGFAAPRVPSVEPLSAAPPGILETGRLRINQASAEDLQSLPGIGPALALRILEERVKRPFRAPEDLLRVRGIGPKKLAQLRDRIDCGPAAPVPSDSTAPGLELP